MSDQRQIVRFQLPKERMAFTGERFTTGLGGAIEHEHRHRYLVASYICRDKDVLDVASGDGYGAAFLASTARSVVGVDISDEAIAYSQGNYSEPRLRFERASATALPIGDASVDVVVSFETIEHFHEQEQFLAEVRRVLRSNGILLISSPNKGIYNAGLDHNHFHVRELTRDEFVAMIKERFQHVQEFEQKATSGSLIVPTKGSETMRFRTHLRLDDYTYQSESKLIRGVYSILAASDAPLPELEWGALDDEGYIGFLQNWITRADEQNANEIARLQQEISALQSGSEARAREADVLRRDLEDSLEHHRRAIAGANLERLRELQEIRRAKAEIEAQLAASASKIQLRETQLHHANLQWIHWEQTAHKAGDRIQLRETQLHEANLQWIHWEQEAHKARAVINALKSSTLWKFMSPLRWTIEITRDVIHRIRRAKFAPPGNTISASSQTGEYEAFEPPAPPEIVEVQKQDNEISPRSASDAPVEAVKEERDVDDQSKARQAALEAVYTSVPASGSAVSLAPRILILAELGLPQCAKYRVWQKKEAIERLGYVCTVASWTDAEARGLIQTHALVIFYRVPGWPDVLKLMEEPARLGIPCYWEVDDLIFDMEIYCDNHNLDHLEEGVKESVLFGVPLYRAALQMCGAGIASTATIAEAMRAVGVQKVLTIQNALDQQTLSIAERLYAQPYSRAADDPIVIFYGSGSKAHNADFLEAAEGIAAVLDQRPNVIFRVAGELVLPPAIERFGDRIQRLASCDFETYLGHLRAADVSIAPLELSVFNDAKSNIKFLEAAVVGVPSVCSPCATFRDVIVEGENGFLAQDANAWTHWLLALCDDAALRRDIGERARASVLARYSPEAIADLEVAPLVADLPKPIRKDLHVLSSNVYFSPQSFGGATIVAEQMVEHCGRRDDTAVSVFTSLGLAREDYARVRYDLRGIPTLAVKMPDHMSREQEFENGAIGDAFLDALEAFQPDVVHFHSIQGLTAAMADVCFLKSVPYVITLHDAWWICERQFMVRDNSKYCFQSRIDHKVCETCVPDIGFTKKRSARLARILANAAMLLTPSAFFRQLYIDNGANPEKIRVNKNGILPPASDFRRSRGEKFRFGFVGGAGLIKGLDLIVKAFQELDRDDYELIVVDNTLNLGFSSIRSEGWKLRGRVTVRPAYSQSELDLFFGGLDVLLFPTQWKESFGLTVREALARDVWVISTDAGGAVEDIVPGENGEIIPLTSDPGPLREAIRALLDAPERLASYVNPHKARITTYAQQAEELREILAQVRQMQPSPAWRDQR